MARRCGAKHICKSKYKKKTDVPRALLEVAMSKNSTSLWHEAHLQVKMLKNGRSASTFGSYDVEKLHAAVARSKFPSQNVKKLRVLDFWKLGCVKIARRCGQKHICKSKCTKHSILGPLFEVPVSKKWHGAVARSTFASQNVKKHMRFAPFWQVPMSQRRREK